jgi:phage baseplate assembly protein gpV
MDAQSRLIARLTRRLSDLERRVENGIRHGTVRKVDAKKGLVRLAVGVDAQSGEEQLSPWVHYAQHAGEYKHHSPPTVGQTLTLLSPGGDFTQAVALNLTWSNKNKSPSDKPDEHVITYAKDGDDGESLKEVRRYKERIFQIGKVVIHMRPDDKDELHVSVGDQKIRIHEGGIEALADVFLHTGSDGSGGVVRHNELNIGDSHKHRDVEPGGGITGIPIPV